MTGSVALIKGRYDKGKPVGGGGMGDVFWAYDHLLQRTVVFKTLRDARDPTALEQFRKECSVLALLSHPNIVDIYDVGEFEEDGWAQPYMVMPLLSGSTLDRVMLEESLGLSIERAVEIASQICLGLQAAHERGVVHRDLKPTNIFVLPDNSVKIIDFGIAHLAGACTSGLLRGTLSYMAPEQFHGAPASPLSDIHALGVICYEMLAHTRPFTGESVTQVIDAIKSNVPVPASAQNPCVSEAISHVVQSALAKDPKDRPQTANEFRMRLRSAMTRGENLSSAARPPYYPTPAPPAPPSPPPTPSPTAGKRRIPSRAVLVGGLAATAMLAALLVRTALGSASLGAGLPPVTHDQRLTKVPITLQVEPNDASVRIGDFSLGTSRYIELPPGGYDMVVSAEGFETLRLAVTIGHGHDLPPVVLSAVTAIFEVSFGSEASVAVDGVPIETVNGGALRKFESGQHRVELSQGTEQGRFVVTTPRGEPPKISGFDSAKMPLVVVSTLGERVFVIGPRRIGVDQKTLDVPAEGLEIKSLAKDSTVLGVVQGWEHRELRIPVTTVPAVYVFGSASGPAVLQINCNEDGATVLVNGRPTGSIRNGRRIETLVPGIHKIKVTKPGFGEIERDVKVGRGRANVHNVEMQRERAALTIDGSTQVAQVLVDGAVVGETEPGKPFVVEVPLGHRRVELRTENHRSNAEREINVQAAAINVVTWADLLTPQGYVQLSAPAEVSVECQMAAGGRTVVLQLGRNELPVGNYACHALLVKTLIRTAAVQVKLGATVPVDFSDVRALAPPTPVTLPEPPVDRASIRGFEGPFRRTHDGWLLLDRGLAASYHGPVGRPVRFEVLRRGGLFGIGSRAEWRFDWPNGNQVRYVLDRDSLDCWVSVDGKSTKIESLPIPANYSRISISITGESLTHDFGAIRIVHTGERLGLGDVARARLSVVGPMGIRNFPETR